MPVICEKWLLMHRIVTRLVVRWSRGFRGSSDRSEKTLPDNDRLFFEDNQNYIARPLLFVCWRSYGLFAGWTKVR